MVTQARSAPSELQIIQEASAWLRGAAARRVNQIHDLSAFGAITIVAPLGRIGPPGSRADRSCDRCDRYVPPRDMLHLLAYQAAPRIVLCAGLCGRCAAKESPRELGQ